MKKITLLITFLLTVISLQAQRASFETVEGYRLGEIKSQHSWIVDSKYSSLFTVSDDYASKGKNSLKIDIDLSGEINSQNMFGPEWDISDYFSPNAGGYEILFNIYLPEKDSGQLAFLVIDDNNYGGLVSQVTFSEGKMNVFGPVKDNLNIVAQNPIKSDKFIPVKIIYDYKNGEIDYCVDHKLVYSGEFWGETSIGTLAFYTSGDNIYYIDEITVKTIEVSEEKERLSLKHYTQNNKLYLNSDFKIQEVSIYNMLGRKVADETFHSTSGSVDIGTLNAGVYLAKALVDNQVKTFKFIKN